MTLTSLNSLASAFKEDGHLFPALFIGHGSPMNAIEDNTFTRAWRSVASKLPRPNAILSISAHWETRGVQVTAMENPRTIHDFGGFPQKLFEQQYPAPGSPETAEMTRQLLAQHEAGADHTWGLDHGTWSVLLPMYPNADIPVLQLSLNRNYTPEQHAALASELLALRKRGVLIIGSGNIVHNLRMVGWTQSGLMQGGFDWAETFDRMVTEKISTGRIDDLIQYRNLGREAQLSIPTPEHYLPLLYVLALQQRNEPLEYFADELVGGSISMRSIWLKGTMS